MKSIKKIAVAAFITGMSFLCSTISVRADENAYYSITNPPEFYGTTKVVISTGDAFSLDDARIRIFARDFEDGDLTSKIKVISNNVNSSKAGAYQVQYQVTDSHGNVGNITVPVIVQDDCTDRYYERTLYTLPSVKNMSAAGTNRGNGHDRQMLGVYMEKDSMIRVKRISGEKNLNLTYWNNDSQTEFSSAIQDEEVEISSSAAGGVPFIQTVYESDEPVVIGITVVDSEKAKVIELPYYHYQDNEEEFFADWESKSDSYAVMESEDLTVLVPYGDRNFLLNYYKNCHKSLSEFFEYWHKVMTEYDEFLGLSYNPQETIDQNVKTKYFFKANKNGAGAAYYSVTHVATHSESAASLFEVNWGGLHEVGHGYQGSLAHNGMELGEVSNNILGHYVQINREIYKYENDWLGAISKIEGNINAQRLNGTVFRELSVSQQLYFLVNLLDTFNPKETYAAVNKLWRRAAGSGKKLTTQDAYVLAIHELYDVNATPYFESWGVEVSESVKAEVSGSENLYFLSDIVNNDTQVENIRQDLSKEGCYSLVTAKDLSFYQLRGNLSLSISIDNIDDLLGKKIIIQNGDSFHREVTVTGKNLTLTDIPAGEYEIVAPVPKENRYDYSKYLYTTVKSTETAAEELVYKEKAADKPSHDISIQLKGYYNITFAVLNLSEDNKLTLESYDRQPHVYFSDAQYAGITVYDSNGNQVFSRSYIGNENAGNLKEEIPFETGYVIEVLHKESGSRLIPYSKMLNGVDSNLVSKDITTTYRIGEYGFYQGENDTSYQAYVDRIDSFAQGIIDELTDEQVGNKNLETRKKSGLFVSIMTLKEAERTEYMEKYRRIYNGSSPNLSVSEVSVLHYEKFNLYKLIRGADVEDGEFALNNKNTTFLNVPSSDAASGDYSVPFEISDSDGNVTKGTLVIHVLKKPFVQKKGTTLSDSKSKAVYKVTKSGTKGGTVQFVRAKNKKVKSITIPDTVKLKGITYKVTSVASKACKNNKKLTKVTIGKNVTYIGKEAFSGCSKLKSITIRTQKLNSRRIGTKAFKGIYKKAVIKVPKSKRTSYKKILKARGAVTKIYK